MEPTQQIMEDVRVILDSKDKRIAALEAELQKTSDYQKDLDDLATCPNCGGDGSIPHQDTSGDLEREPCQLCDTTGVVSAAWMWKDILRLSGELAQVKAERDALNAKLNPPPAKTYTDAQIARMIHRQMAQENGGSDDDDKAFAEAFYDQDIPDGS